MPTVLTPCPVPWAVSPSFSGIMLTHDEGDVEPECVVVLSGGRLTDEGLIDSRRIEIVFDGCRHARVGPQRDTEGVEAIGYAITPALGGDLADVASYFKWWERTWRETGRCPYSKFYYALQSDWLATLPADEQNGRRHYVIGGRESYVELIARRFRWREWIWEDGHRDSLPSREPVAGDGEGM